MLRDFYICLYKNIYIYMVGCGRQQPGMWSHFGDPRSLDVHGGMLQWGGMEPPWWFGRPSTNVLLGGAGRQGLLEGGSISCAD